MVSQCGAGAWLNSLASGDQRRLMGSSGASEACLRRCAIQIHATYDGHLSLEAELDRTGLKTPKVGYITMTTVRLDSQILVINSVTMTTLYFTLGRLCRCLHSGSFQHLHKYQLLNTDKFDNSFSPR